MAKKSEAAAPDQNVIAIFLSSPPHDMVRFLKKLFRQPFVSTHRAAVVLTDHGSELESCFERIYASIKLSVNTQLAQL